MNATEINAHLDDVQIKQLVFKPGVSRNVMVAIAQAFLDGQAHWPDGIKLPEVEDADKKCIGSAWRTLKNAGMIAQTGEHRRSKADGRKGGVIFQYRPENLKLIRTFLKANGWTDRPQGELALAIG